MDTNESYNNQNYSQIPPQENNYQPQPKMKWYKFLIYFSLFFSAFTNLVSGILQITGLQYYMTGVDSSAVYAYYGVGFKMLDVIFGIFMIALAGYCIYVRFRLARFKQNGPLSLYILYAVNSVASALYYIAASVLTGIMMLDVTSIASLFSTIVVLVLNVVYFNKRKHLFVN